MGRQTRRNRSYDSDSFQDRKPSRKARTNVRQRSGYGEVIPLPNRSRDVFRPWNDKQRVYASAIKASHCTFAIGPAGTAKSHVAIASNIEWLEADREHQMILLNPGVEIGDKKLGTLPGDKGEKIAVEVRPMRDILNKVLSAPVVDSYEESGKIKFEPIGSILGCTFDNALIVLDEAQNATPEQMKALLTRVGRNSKIVIAGDFKEQKFIDGKSGLEDAINRLRHIAGVSIIEFDVNDIVRGPFCKAVIQAYRDNA